MVLVARGTTSTQRRDAAGEGFNRDEGKRDAPEKERTHGGTILRRCRCHRADDEINQKSARGKGRREKTISARRNCRRHPLPNKRKSLTRGRNIERSVVVDDDDDDRRASGSVCVWQGRFEFRRAQPADSASTTPPRDLRHCRNTRISRHVYKDPRDKLRMAAAEPHASSMGVR